MCLRTTLRVFIIQHKSSLCVNTSASILALLSYFSRPSTFIGLSANRTGITPTVARNVTDVPYPERFDYHTQHPGLVYSIRSREILNGVKKIIAFQILSLVHPLETVECMRFSGSARNYVEPSHIRFYVAIVRD